MILANVTRKVQNDIDERQIKYIWAIKKKIKNQLSLHSAFTIVDKSYLKRLFR